MPQTIYMPQKQQWWQPAVDQTSQFLWNLLGMKVQHNIQMDLTDRRLKAEEIQAKKREERAEQRQIRSEGRAEQAQIRAEQRGSLGNIDIVNVKGRPVALVQTKSGVVSGSFLPLDKESNLKPSTIELADPENPSRTAIYSLDYKQTPSGMKQTVGNKLGYKPDAKNPQTAENAQKTATVLRKEYTQQSKTYINVRDAYNRVIAAAEDPSAAGDLALIFNYMKVLDPESVVREGEFATAETAGSIPQRTWAKYNKILQGERLSPEMRKDFVNRTEKLYNKQKGSQKQLVSEYKRKANQYSVSPEMVIVDYFPKENPMQIPNQLQRSHVDPKIDAINKKYNLIPVE